MNFKIHFKKLLWPLHFRRQGTLEISNIFRIMKLVVILILAFSFTATSKSFSQVDISFQNASLKEVMTEISKQTGYAFMYSDANVKEAKKVSVKLHNVTLEDALKSIFDEQPLTYTINEQSVMVTKKEKTVFKKLTEFLTPPINIKGRVVDSVGRPLSGATIKVKGLKMSTSTNYNGEFRLNGVEEDAVLVISYLGYMTKEVRAGNELSGIMLKASSSDIEEVEVVSTGYQKIPKERATGSFGQITNSDLNEITTVNIMDRLEGQVAGLQFDNRSGKPSLNIRGLNTFNSVSSKPLIVLDNFPYDGNLENINPNDIESVTVLKDAAASSIWGSRAGNGVIVITSKKSKNGAKTLVSFSGNTLFTQKPDLFYKPLISSRDFINVELMLFENGFYDKAYSSSTKQRTVFSPLVDLLYANKEGKVPLNTLEQNIENWSNQDYRKDFRKYLLRNGIAQQYFATIETNNDWNKMRVSLGYDRQLRTQIKSNNDRFTFNISNETKLGHKLSLLSRVSYTENIDNRSNSFPSDNLSPGGTRTEIYPYAQLMNLDGQSLSIPKNLNYLYADSAGGGKLLDWLYKPVYDVDKSSATGSSKHLAANLQLQYNILKSLRAELIYGYENQSTQTELHYQEESFYARDLINRYSQLVNTNIKYNIPRGDILNKSISQLQSHRIRGQLNFNKSWEERHRISWLLGGEISSSNSTSDSYGVYGYDKDVMTSKSVDYTSLFPSYGNLSGNQNIPFNSSYNDRMVRYVSMFSNIQYDFLDKYSVSMSARQDASNGYGSKTNSRWNPLWSAGLAWQLSNERFMRDIYWLDFLKLRSTVGIGGNAVASSSMEATLTFSSNSPYSGLPYAQVFNAPNPSLKWETVKMNNYGLDFSILKRRLSGSIEYYVKHSYDILSEDIVDPSSGFGAMNKNVGEINSKGIDLSLTGNMSIGQIQWTPQIIFSYADNKVTSYKGGKAASVNYVNGGVGITPIQGKPLYGVFSYKFAGLDPQNGDPIGYLNGVESKEYAKIIGDALENLNFHGSALPPFYGSFNNTFAYKKISLSVNTLFKWGHYFKRESIGYSALFNNWNGHGDFEQRWQKPGDEMATTVPSMSFPADANRDNFYIRSSANIDRGDLIRLQSVRLSYQINLKTKGIQGTVFLGANNLGIIWKRNKSTLDPDFIGMPSPKVFTMGLNVQL